MAHSYIQAHDSEYEAFRSFLKVSPEAVLLVDTYDTLEGVRQVIRLAHELGAGFRAAGIRLDSGDLASLAVEARRLLNEAGLSGLKIFASSSLDEYAIEQLVSAGAPIDGFGVGTRMAVSADAPSLDTAYKLVEYSGRPRIKRSPGKVIVPGRKQVFRQFEQGTATGDILALREEQLPGKPLLEHVMARGRRLQPPHPVAEIRSYCAGQIRSLPAALLRLTPAPFPVSKSAQLQRLAESLLSPGR
jgi:nicotinate phosphoribosyltransferase